MSDKLRIIASKLKNAPACILENPMKITKEDLENIESFMRRRRRSKRVALDRNAGHSDSIRRRYVAVTEMFAYGTTTAIEICSHFNLDPDEIVGTDEDEEEDDEYGT